MTSTQLTDLHNLDLENMVFSKPEIGNIAGQKLSFKRIRVATRYPDGSIGDLVIATPPNLHSFGLQETRDMGSNLLNGYTMPLCLWNRNGPTADEKLFTDQFTAIVERCKKYLLDHRDEIEKYDLEASDLKKFNPLYWKMEKGKVVEGRGPMLYTKVIYNKKKEKIETIFVNEDTNEEIDPFEMLNKVCTATAAVKIESIFIGNKISLQVKLFEVVCKVKEQTMRGLLRPNALKRDFPTTSRDVLEHLAVDNDDDSGSIILEEDTLASAPTSLPAQGVPVVLQQVDQQLSLDDDVVEDDDDDEDEDDTVIQATQPPPPPPPVVAPTETKKRAPARSKAKK